MIHLWKPAIHKRQLALCLAGAGLGILAFLCINTGLSLDVTNDAWILGGYIDTDMMQHYAGWLFYRASPWSFPLGAAQAMSGTSITFSDSVPIAAILCKLISPLFSGTFQYFGFYTLLCYALQGVSAALLLSLFFKENAWGNACVLLGTALFILSPVMVDRSFRHTSLASHFLILFALYLYFKNKKEPYRLRYGWLLLCAFSVMIHPYFVPMVLALLFADLLEHAVQTREWVKSLAFLGSNLACVLLAGWLIGAFSMPGSVDSAYGYWSMNLNALYNPRVFLSMPWSKAIPIQPLTNGNADGFNYLGLGVLLFGAAGLILWAVRGGWRRLGALLRRHFGLLFVCVALSIFAVTHVVTWNGSTLFTLPLPERLVQLCSVFRASGRMFWPVNYLLLLCTVCFWGRCGVCAAAHNTGGTQSAALKWPKAAAGTFCLAGLVLLQLWDISPGLAAKRQLFTQPGMAFTATKKSTAWDAMAGQYKTFFSLNSPLLHPHEPALWAAKNGMTTNDPFTARFDRPAHEADIDAAMEQLLAGKFDADTLYFTCDLGRFQQIAEALLAADADVTLAQLDSLWYAVIPNKPGASLPAENESFVLYPHFPLFVADYTDALWTGGVLNSDPRIVLLYDSAVTAAVLDGADALVCEGEPYSILKADYKDAGWVMVTLDIPDAGVLRGKVLTQAAKGGLRETSRAG